MNTFDLHIMVYINQFSQYSLTFNKIIALLSACNLLKGGVLVTLIWWAWFKGGDRQPHNREHILSTLLCCFIAEFISRLLSLTLPFRIRPLYEKKLDFFLPYGLEKPNFLDSWSSFPSDHAVLFFSLSAGLLFVSRKAGAFALAYTTLLIAFPRIYLGLHYPTDIISGAVIGITVTVLGNIYFVPNKYLKSISNWSHSKPDVFYPIFFIFTYQIIEMFDDVRSIISLGYKSFISHGGYFWEYPAHDSAVNPDKPCQLGNNIHVPGDDTWRTSPKSISIKACPSDHRCGFLINTAIMAN